MEVYLPGPDPLANFNATISSEAVGESTDTGVYQTFEQTVNQQTYEGYAVAYTDGDSGERVQEAVVYNEGTGEILDCDTIINHDTVEDPDYDCVYIIDEAVREEVCKKSLAEFKNAVYVKGEGNADLNTFLIQTLDTSITETTFCKLGLARGLNLVLV